LPRESGHAVVNVSSLSDACGVSFLGMIFFYTLLLTFKCAGAGTCKIKINCVSNLIRIFQYCWCCADIINMNKLKLNFNYCEININR
jgi:hypothetical protein